MSGPWGPTFDSQTLAAQRDYGSCLPAIEDGPRGLCVDLLTFTYHGGPRLPDNAGVGGKGRGNRPHLPQRYQNKHRKTHADTQFAEADFLEGCLSKRRPGESCQVQGVEA